MVCKFLVAFSVDVGLARRITPKILARTKIFVNVFDSAQYQQVAQRVEDPANMYMQESCRQLLIAYINYENRHIIKYFYVKESSESYYYNYGKNIKLDYSADRLMYRGYATEPTLEKIGGVSDSLITI